MLQPHFRLQLSETETEFLVVSDTANEDASVHKADDEPEPDSPTWQRLLFLCLSASRHTLNGEFFAADFYLIEFCDVLDGQGKTPQDDVRNARMVCDVVQNVAFPMALSLITAFGNRLVPESKTLAGHAERIIDVSEQGILKQQDNGLAACHAMRQALQMALFREKAALTAVNVATQAAGYWHAHKDRADLRNAWAQAALDKIRNLGVLDDISQQQANAYRRNAKTYSKRLQALDELRAAVPESWDVLRETVNCLLDFAGASAGANANEDMAEAIADAFAVFPEAAEIKLTKEAAQKRLNAFQKEMLALTSRVAGMKHVVLSSEVQALRADVEAAQKALNSRGGYLVKIPEPQEIATAKAEHTWQAGAFPEREWSVPLKDRSAALLERIENEQQRRSNDDDAPIDEDASSDLRLVDLEEGELVVGVSRILSNETPPAAVFPSLPKTYTEDLPTIKTLPSPRAGRVPLRRWLGSRQSRGPRLAMVASLAALAVGAGLSGHDWWLSQQREQIIAQALQSAEARDLDRIFEAKGRYSEVRDYLLRPIMGVPEDHDDLRALDTLKGAAVEMVGRDRRTQILSAIDEALAGGDAETALAQVETFKAALSDDTSEPRLERVTALQVLALDKSNRMERDAAVEEARLYLAAGDPVAALEEIKRYFAHLSETPGDPRTPTMVQLRDLVQEFLQAPSRDQAFAAMHAAVAEGRHAHTLMAAGDFFDDIVMAFPDPRRVEVKDHALQAFTAWMADGSASDQPGMDRLNILIINILSHPSIAGEQL